MWAERRLTVAMIGLLGLALAVRLVFWLSHYPNYYYQDASFYVQAGTQYLKGVSPTDLNAEHPPLAKYIIGVFAVYLGEPSLATLLFGFFAIVVSALIVQRVVPEKTWSLVVVWLMAFDTINVGISVFPVLEIFMVFFALSAVLLALGKVTTTRTIATGACLGLAMACKWTAVAFVVPVVAWILLDRRFLDSLLVAASAVDAYVVTYAQVIASQGFRSFLTLQSYMASFMSPRGGVYQAGLLQNAVNVVLFHLTTYVPSLLYAVPRQQYPEAFSLFGESYFSFVDVVNPAIMLMLFPLCYYLVKTYRDRPERGTLLVLMIVFAAAAEEVLLPPDREPWLYAPISVSLCLGIPLLLRDYWRRGPAQRAVAKVYLSLVPALFFFALVITLLRFGAI